MSGKDFLTLLLVCYNFKEVEITTYVGERGSIGYDIYAINKELDEHYCEINCEGLLFNIVHIIEYMTKHGIEPTYDSFPGYNYSIKTILEKTQK
jgi:hypothetical protein